MSGANTQTHSAMMKNSAQAHAAAMAQQAAMHTAAMAAARGKIWCGVKKGVVCRSIQQMPLHSACEQKE